jgi:hypothetical protein
MKPATKVLARRVARAREAEELRAVRARDSVTFADVRFRGQQLPLSFAPYRLQAADRWWRESCHAQSEPRTKRHS